MIVSHRGRGTDTAENSISAFEKVLKLGADAIECDVRLTSDNKVVVAHDDILCDSKDERLLTIDELFEYIKIKRVPFFLEVKSSSLVLVEAVVLKIKQENLWDTVYIIGFSVFIKKALKLQKEYPKLKVLPFVNFPLYSFLKLPEKSYGLFLGWINEWPGAQLIFRTLIPEWLLKELRKMYEKNGFKVMAGVINNKEGMLYFKKAGITDIVTDEILLAVEVFKTN